MSSFSGFRLPCVVLLLAGGLLVAFRPAPPDEGDMLVRIMQRLGAYYASTQPEKAYLHLDKAVYGTGETIWFSAYVVDAQRHQPDSLSRVLHVELLSPQRQVLARRTLALRGGFSHGDVALPDTLPVGTYLLRAYTNWMRNAGPDFFYSRRLQVWPASPLGALDDKGGPSGEALAPTAPPVAAARPDVQFLPEGGALVETLPAVVACKATDVSGQGIDVSGDVLDARDQVVATFSTGHLGMGRFTLVPAAGQRYHARVKLPGNQLGNYPLPAAQHTGYTLHLVELGNLYVAEVRYHGAAGAAAPSPVQLLAEVRGFLVRPVAQPISEGAPAYWRLPKDKLPAGILHATLFDALGTPQAERLAFVLPSFAASLRVALVPDQTSYGPRSPVQLAVRVTDAAGQPVPARLSVAITEAGAAALDPDAETIASNLLLTSDLAGYVESPGYYFRQPSAATALALDNLLLTQGWRRFVWKDVLAGPLPAIAFHPEQSIELHGQVVSERNRPVTNSQLVASVGQPVPQFFSGSTGADGRFQFAGLSPTDTTTLTLQAKRRAGEASVLIRPDQGPPAPGPPLSSLPTVPPAPVADYLGRSRQQRQAELELHPDERLRNIRLGMVTVTAQRATVRPDDPRRLFGTANATIIDFAKDPLYQTGMPVMQMLEGRVPGLSISSNPLKVSIRNGSTPVFVLDGVESSIEQVAYLQSASVEAVEVFKGTEGAMFGKSGGVIAIYTKQGDAGYKGTRRSVANVLQVRVPCYYRARQFFAPRYDLAPTALPDPRRTTLYWNPTVQTNAKGEAQLRFFTADGGGRFQVTAEGITPAGQLVQGGGTLAVQGR
jgi:hypothetical protein